MHTWINKARVQYAVLERELNRRSKMYNGNPQRRRRVHHDSLREAEPMRNPVRRPSLMTEKKGVADGVDDPRTNEHVPQAAAADSRPKQKCCREYSDKENQRDDVDSIEDDDVSNVGLLEDHSHWSVIGEERT